MVSSLLEIHLCHPAVFCWVRVPGRPAVKQRPRINRRVSFNPSAKKEHDLGWAVRAAYPGMRPDAAEYALRILVRTDRPGDHDNFSKLIGDALQGVVWLNDRQVKECYTLIEPCIRKDACLELLWYKR